MRELLGFIDANQSYFLLGLIALAGLLLVYCICLSRRLKKLVRKRSARLVGDNVEDIVSAISDQFSALTDLQGQVEDLRSRVADQAEVLAGCIRRVGVVRFNAYDDVGGEQSFSLVLLDDKKNGLAVSSLYGRQDSRLYAKRITNGEAERPLSEEERGALDMALSGREQAAGAAAGR
jgi:hypothetical protein